MTKRLGVLALVSVLAMALVAPAAAADDDTGDRLYKVTVVNLTATQPMSPIVAASHRPSVSLFDVGAPASGAIEAIAENGDQSIAVAELVAQRRVSDVVDVGVPLTPNGVVIGDFTDTVEFYISARPGDRFSMATMLICTNDGFTGVDGVLLPRFPGQVVSGTIGAYDAGTEENTELSSDIVDPCSALGPVALAGDDNGNSNDADTDGVIAAHPGVDGTIGDLLPAHDWDEPVAYVRIELAGE